MGAGPACGCQRGRGCAHTVRLGPWATLRCDGGLCAGGDAKRTPMFAAESMLGAGGSMHRSFEGI